jgi:hypothetical protein
MSYQSQSQCAGKTLDEIVDCLNELAKLRSELMILQLTVDHAMQHLSKTLVCHQEMKRQLDPDSRRGLAADNPDEAELITER